MVVSVSMNLDLLYAISISMSLSNLHLPLYLHLYLVSVAHDDADDGGGDSDGHDHAHHDDGNNNDNNTNNDNGNHQNNGNNDNNSSNSHSSKNSGRPIGPYTSAWLPTGTCSAVGISNLTYRGVQRPFTKLDQGSQSLLPCGRRRAAAPAMLGRHLEGQKRHTAGPTTEKPNNPRTRSQKPPTIPSTSEPESGIRLQETGSQLPAALHLRSATHDCQRASEFPPRGLCLLPVARGRVESFTAQEILGKFIVIRNLIVV